MLGRVPVSDFGNAQRQRNGHSLNYFLVSELPQGNCGNPEPPLTWPTSVFFYKGACQISDP